MRRAPLALLLAVLALAGCMGGAKQDAPVAAAAVNHTVQVGDRPDTNFTEVKTGPAAAPDLNATLAAAPRLVKGEWWKIHLDSPLTGAHVDFVRVVADVQGDDYVVGMPHEGWYKEGIIYHSPAFGDVAAKDLSYTPHNVRFTPVQFPLTDGATWTTEFEGPPQLTAHVKTDAAANTAKITFTDANGRVAIEETYDATQHEVVAFKNNYMTYNVVEHGYDFRGWVTVPRGEKLVFFNGRVAQGLDATLGPSPAPLESVDVEGGYNRLSFVLQTGAFLGTPASPGVYNETATAPDGTVYSQQSPPTGDFMIQFFESEKPNGVWQLQHVAAGPGLAFIEGIAYHQYDIRLPDGAIRADHSHPVIR